MCCEVHRYLSPFLTLIHLSDIIVACEKACFLVACDFMMHRTLEDIPHTLSFALTITFSMPLQLKNNMVCAYFVHSEWRKCPTNKTHVSCEHMLSQSMSWLLQPVSWMLD